MPSRISSFGRVFFAMAALSLVATLLGPASARDAPEDAATFAPAEREEFAPGRIIVKPAENAPDGRVGEIGAEIRAEVEDRIPGTGISVVDLPEGLPVQRAVERYENASRVEYAEPDFKLYPSDVTPDDPWFDELYGLRNTGQTGGNSGADISAPAAWEQTTGRERTVVAVTDTGVQRGHTDLSGNMWVNEDERYTSGADDDGNGYADDRYGWDFYNDDKTVYDSGDGDEHGTHVAGTLAAEGNNGRGVTGVNWQADIMVLRFLGPNGGYTSDAVEALNYAVDNGAPVSNNSWGGGGKS